MPFTGRLGSSDSRPANVVLAFGSALAVIAPLVATAGTYALSGSSATLRRARRLVATPGAYAVTGAPATLGKARRLVATPGVYVVTGLTAQLRRARRLVATPGAYARTGTSTTLGKSRRLVATPGTYAATGQAASLRRARRLVATPGLYATTGQLAALRETRRLVATLGSYALTGSAATLTFIGGPAPLALAATAGLYGITGSAATGLLARRRRRRGTMWLINVVGLGRFSNIDLDDLPDFYAGALLDEPTITRRLQETRWGPVEVQDVTVTLANIKGSLTAGYLADLREAVFTLQRYDRATSLITTEWTGVVNTARLSRGQLTLEGSNLDLAVLEEDIPRGVITKDVYPLAEPNTLGLTPPWVFGQVTNLPLLYVRDDLPKSRFDYVVCRDTAITLENVWRIGGNDTRFPILPSECSVVEPVLNGDFEQWDGGNNAPPTGWTVTGAGATASRNTTPAQVWEDVSAVNLTRAGENCMLYQHILTATLPITFWRERVVMARCRVRASVPGTAQLYLVDSFTYTASPFHTGSGTYEWLTFSHTMTPAATYLFVACVILGATPGDNSTAQFDACEVLVPARSWEEALRTDLAAGMTGLRFFQRQDDSNNNLFRLIADVHGRPSLANPVRAVRTMLTDATSGLGKTVDAASFDAAEIAVTLDYPSAVRLDDPEVFYDFDEQGANAIVKDTSGHLRHGTLIIPAAAQWAGGPNTNDSGDIALHLPNVSAYVQVPYGGWQEPDTGSLSVEVWYLPIANSGDRAIVTKSCNLGGTTIQYALHHTAAGSIQFDLLMTPSTPSVAMAVTVGVWTHIVGTYSPEGGEFGALRLYKNGVLAATTFPTGGSPALDLTGEPLLIGRHANLPTLPNGVIDKVAIYRTALPAARILAHFNARSLDQDPVSVYDDAVMALNPELYYPLHETSGTVASDAAGGIDGTYVNSPTRGVPGPTLTTRRGRNAGTAVRFSANVAQYIRVDGQTFNGAAMSIVAWWKPALQKSRSGIIDKTVAGGPDTQWSLSQTPEGLIRFRLKDGTATQRDATFALTADDPGRWMLLGVTFAAGTITLYRNGVLMATTAYTGTPASGVGQMLFGRFISLDATGAQGDLGPVAIWTVTALPAEQIYTLAVAGTWVPGGLAVSAALTEPQEAQTWLDQIFQMRGMRFGGVTALGGYTLSVDTVEGALVLGLRDGAGDGVRNVLSLQDRHRTALNDAVSDLVIKYRPDLLSGTFLGELRRAVSAHGKEHLIESTVIGDATTADRVAHYLAARMATDETVTVEVIDEGVQLLEGHRVTLEDADTGYSGETLEVLEVAKQLNAVRVTLGEWTSDRYTYVPNVLPIGEP